MGTVQGHQHAIRNDNNDAQQKELKSIVVWYTLTFQQLQQGTAAKLIPLPPEKKKHIPL